MSVEIKSAIILLIGAAIFGIIQFAWEKHERSNKIIADIIGVVAAIAYLYLSLKPDNKMIAIAVLLLSILAIIVLIFKKEAAVKVEPQTLSSPKEEEIAEAEPLDRIEEEPQAEEPLDRVDEEPQKELFQAEPAVEPLPEVKEGVMEQAEVKPKEEEKSSVAYQDGLIDVTVTEKKKEEPLDTAHDKYKPASVNDSSAHTNMGVTLKNKGRTSEAILKWQEAIKIDPNDYKAHHYLAKTYKEQGLLNEAASEFKKVITINPKVAEAHYALGFDYSANGRIHNAIDSFENFVKYASPKDAELVEEVKRMMEHLKTQIGS
ncbi:tetratricopeptide repeat protein [Thermodesulfobacteriota bacterium]